MSINDCRIGHFSDLPDDEKAKLLEGIATWAQQSIFYFGIRDKKAGQNDSWVNTIARNSLVLLRVCPAKLQTACR